MSRRQAFVRMYGLLLIYGIGLALCVAAMSGCISQRSWQTAKSHAEEVSIAAAGGAIGVFTGGLAGVAVAFAGMSTAALVGETNRPPDAEVHTTTTVDEKGHIIDQKTTRTESKSMPDTGFIHSITSWFDALWKVAVGILVLMYLITHPASVKALIGSAQVGVQFLKNAAKTVQKGLHPVAIKKMSMSRTSTRPNKPMDPQ